MERLEPLNGDTHLPVGTDFHGYRIEGLIGQGGMGVVYRALDVRLKRTVALKVMAPELGSDELFRERFARETEVAMALEHPNVVPIHDAGEIDGRLYLAMRYVDGSDLRAVLRAEGALPPERAVAICAQVASALDAAHARGLVHRDVKPSNVLLDSAEHAYLADFGLTRRFAEEGPAGDSRSLGTPAYLAPEQIEGGPIDGRADVYSLACLLFECLTGAPPFARSSRLGVAWAHLEEEPPQASAQNADLPAAIDGVIAKGMAKEPVERYSRCSELIAAARAALGLEIARRSRRRGLAVVAATAALTVVAVVAALVLTHGDSASAGRPPVVRADTLVRVDPRNNVVDTVIDVEEEPIATAVAGRTVWVYSKGSRTVSEVDADTKTVIDVTPVSTIPLDDSSAVGPLLAADARGAWLVGLNLETGASLLTRIFAGAARKTEYRLQGALLAVGIAGDRVWVLAGRRHGNVVLRIDPKSGRVEQTIRLDTPNGTSLGVGADHVWVVSQSDGLYRIDASSGRITGRRKLGECAARPGVGLGSIWLCVCNPGSAMLRIDPTTLRNVFMRNALPAQDGMFSVGYGSVWWHDVPSGDVIRFSPATGDRAAVIRITPGLNGQVGAMETSSISAGADGVWVSVIES